MKTIRTFLQTLFGHHPIEHFSSALSDLRMELYFETCGHPEIGPSDLRLRWQALRSIVHDRKQAAICVLRDHDYVNDGADVENGSEDLHCKRCGIQQHIQF